MNLRNSILSLLLILPILASGYWFFFGEGADWKARKAFEDGQWEAAKNELKAVHAKIPPAEFALYAGYIAREQGDLGGSTAAFQEAFGANPTLRLREEILINQAYNAFLTRNPEQMQKTLKELERKRSDWYSYLSILYAFLRNSTGDNLARLQDTPVPLPLSPWMKKAFSSSFSPFWFGKQSALTLMEEGNTVQARQQLEKIAKEASVEEREEIAFLTGLSYLKEARERPPIAATPYYKLAFSYFERIPFQEPRFQKGRTEALAQVDRQLDHLFEEKRYENIPFYASVVDKWAEEPAKQKLASHLADLVNTQEYSQPLVEALSHLSNAQGFTENLQEKALVEIQNGPFDASPASASPQTESDVWSLSVQHHYIELAQEAFVKGDVKQAEANLQAALSVLPPTNAFLREALPLSAQIFALKGDPFDAVLAWNKSFSLQPSDALGRVDYGRNLMEVLRYDLAANQFAFMAQNAYLTPQEELLYIESLILSGQAKQGRDRALELAPKLDGEEALRLSAVAFPLHDHVLNEKLLKQIPPPDKWDEPLKLAAFRAALDKGDYDLAARLYAAEKTALNKSAQGKFLLANFYSQIGHPKTALKYAQEAFQSDPRLPGLDPFIEQHTLDAGALKARLTATENALKEDPLSLGLQLKKGQILIDLSIASQEKSSLPISKMPELRSAYALLQGLKDKGQEFPLYHFLFGLSSFLLNEDEAAIKSFEKALQLNPGYPDAAKYLALAYSREGKGAKAAEVMLNALKFHPIDGEGWQVLADVYSAGGEGLEAGAALENALRYRPNNINTLLSAANYKLELQNPEEAQRLVDKALKLNPQNQRALMLRINILNNPLLTEHQSVGELKSKLRQTLEDLRKVNPTLAAKIEKELKL